MNDQHDAHVFVVVPSSIFFCSYSVSSSFFVLCVSLLWLGSNISLSMRTKSPLLLLCHPCHSLRSRTIFECFRRRQWPFVHSFFFSFFAKWNFSFISQRNSNAGLLRAEKEEALMDFCLLGMARHFGLLRSTDYGHPMKA